MEEEMEELCIEVLPNHDDRERWVGLREGAGEASVAARAGRAIEPRNHRVRGADAVYEAGRQHRRRRYARAAGGPRAVMGTRACTEPPCARTGRARARP